MLRIVCAWLMLFRLNSGLLCAYIAEPLQRQDIPALREDLVVPLSCSEVFNLTDPRNCCSIPYLLPQHAVKECLQIPLSPIAMEADYYSTLQCRAECVLNETGILEDGNFQQETAIELLTNATTEDQALAERIRYAVTKCEKIVFVRLAHGIRSPLAYFYSTFLRLLQYCGCAMPYDERNHLQTLIRHDLSQRCPLQYWSGTDECGRLVHMLNGCPYFLVHSNNF
uniref:Uncharacterized protein n=1 Tax=Anopheles dirus TaxID=7168 RepID=A0A182N7K2_9DIPT